MTNQEVPKVKTPISEAELSRSFIDVAKDLFKIDLNKQQLSILIAQNNLETGSRASMYNFNIGNITHKSTVDSFDYFMGGDKTRGKDGKWVPTKYQFRAYENLNEGVKDYLKNLKFRGKGNVWNAVMSADPTQFSKALKDTRYYEADEADYTKGMIAGVNAFNKRKSYEDAIAGNFTVTTNSASDKSIKPDFLSEIGKLVDNFLSAIAKSENNNFIK